MSGTITNWPLTLEQFLSLPEAEPALEMGPDGEITQKVSPTTVHALLQLEIATRLNDFKDDLCIVGGLVPSLLIDMATLPSGAEAHIGTNDLDLGLSVGLLNEQRYEEIAKRLREAGFQAGTSQLSPNSRIPGQVPKSHKFSLLRYPRESSRAALMSRTRMPPRRHSS